MTANELRKKYLEFFENKGHKVIPSAPLVPENDPTTLFTSSGMQQLVPFLKGQPYPGGEKCLTDSQPCFRAEDIDEVGDNRHTTFFEMLGNWSLGDYFKKEQLAWIWQFLTEELKLPKEKLYVTVFEGFGNIPKDTESEAIWKELGIAEDHIHFYGPKKNWWSRSGTPELMPAGEIGGPDSEVFFEFTQIEHDPKHGEKCHPNCDCGRFLEIGNSVFIQYEKQTDDTFKELPQKNVDFGGGLERITAALTNTPDVFQTDLYLPLIKKLEELTNKKYEQDEIKRDMRIIADHLKAASFLIISGVEPSNKLQGYVLRRLLRRATVKMKSLGGDPLEGFRQLADLIIYDIYDRLQFFYKPSLKEIDFSHTKVIASEIIKFNQTLDRGLKEFNKLATIDGKVAFDLFQTYGFPLELTEELAEEKGLKIDREEFRKEFEKHKELSRTASAGMFKGGLGEQSEITTKYHTATHLLHASLREVLGDHVQQKGSNITAERLRFDFSHSEKMTEEQIKEVERLVNKAIKENLPVSSEVMNKEDALNCGALGFFTEKYGDKVTVYTVGDFSKEICGGPHVKSTGELGKLTIIKEESTSAGIRRIYATLD